MNVNRYGALVLVALATMRGSAGAQTVDGLADDFAAAVERRAGQIAAHVERQANRMAERIERQADSIAKAIEAQIELRQSRRGRGPGGPEVTEAFNRTVRLGRNGTFDLQNVSGDITVTGGGGDNVRIDATKRVRFANQNEAKNLLSEMTIRVDERDGRVEVRTDYPRRRNWGGSVDYTVSVPRDASVILKTMSGNVRITGVNGEVRAESFSGDMTTDAVRRLRSLKTMSGNLEISNAAAEELSASSLNGDVIVSRLKASGVDIQTIGGDVRLTDVDADHATLRTFGGDIDYTGRFARSGRYEFKTHSGDVRLTPTDNRGFSLEAQTFNGDVRSDFPLTLQSTPGNSFGPGRGRNQSVRGSFGDGSATISLTSFSGDIVIVKK